MPRKTVAILNVERGKMCENCSFSYTSYQSREEMLEKQDVLFVNRCGSKIRKKTAIPKDGTCEHWSDTRDTYGADFRAENKLSDKKEEKV